eukprot:scaffold88423_cov55-Attheya_sp.AAC.1
MEIMFTKKLDGGITDDAPWQEYWHKLVMLVKDTVNTTSLSLLLHVRHQMDDQQIAHTYNCMRVIDGIGEEFSEVEAALIEPFVEGHCIVSQGVRVSKAEVIEPCGHDKWTLSDVRLSFYHRQFRKSSFRAPRDASTLCHNPAR